MIIAQAGGHPHDLRNLEKYDLNTKIRTATSADITQIAKLYRDTILQVNAWDYDAEQVKAWSARWANVEGWQRRVAQQYFIVAVRHETIIGFASMDSLNYIDMLFVDHGHQRQGIATALLTALESKASGILTTDASITARPFFERQGYKIISQQTVMIADTALVNYRMQKSESVFDHHSS